MNLGELVMVSWLKGLTGGKEAATPDPATTKKEIVGLLDRVMVAAMQGRIKFIAIVAEPTDGGEAAVVAAGHTNMRRLISLIWKRITKI